MKFKLRRFSVFSFAALAIVLLLHAGARAATFDVDIVGSGDMASIFVPKNITVQPGDTVVWHWPDMVCTHSVTSGSSCDPDGIFDSGVKTAKGITFSYTFSSVGAYPYFSTPECIRGTVGSVTVSETLPPPPAPQLLNISTREQVQSGDNVLIGGFIITGSVPKSVLLRALGPSLSNVGVTGVLDDPVLELHGSDGSLVTSDDNWKDAQEAAIEATGVAPNDDLESAILMTLAPDSYTAIVRGKGDTSGVGLIEAYDLSATADSQLANISTRGFVGSTDKVMIGGFILGNADGTANVLIRALGPSLAAQGVSGALSNPTLELHDQDGALVMSNDDWKSTQQAEIEATGLAPANDCESAMLVTIPATAHTAIVSGKGGETGVALVEVYRLP
jgi:plastocyanin